MTVDEDGSTSEDTRASRARATRQRVITAAYELMSDRGYPQTTMADIAARAGVAVQTVYFGFGNKPGLLCAAFQYAVRGDHQPVPPHKRQWFETFTSEPDFAFALTTVVEETTSILERVAPLTAAMRTLADDPNITEFQQQSDRLREDGYRLTIELLAAKRPLRTGVDIDEATTVLLLILGPDAYRSMVIDHHWNRSRWITWTAQMIRESLFQPIEPSRQ
ncbi:TetR/AcrR family transcriptional regulator [Nocardia sp. NPDC088792]|uniref:TetR/AcrR family transcriptional regulator n=1 Tax=Nocardia sp. NPDC088792 TaxID=3364332 RepID=UPI003824309B